MEQLRLMEDSHRCSSAGRRDCSDSATRLPQGVSDHFGDDTEKRLMEGVGLEVLWIADNRSDGGALVGALAMVWLHWQKERCKRS